MARRVDITVFGSAVVLAGILLIPAVMHESAESAPLAGVDPPAPVPLVSSAMAMVQPTDTPPSIDRLRTRSRAANTLSPELMARCLEVARDVDPELADRLETIRETRSEQDLARAMRNARHLVGLARLKTEDPPLYDVKVKSLKIDAQVERLLDAVIVARQLSGAAAVELEDQLLRLVREQVAYSLVARGMYLIRLSDHVKGLQEQLEHDVENVKAAVKSRMDELLQRTP